VRTEILAFAVAASVLRADAGDFARSSTFKTVEDFVEAATAFQPATGKSDLSALFMVRELGQPEDPKTGTPITATSIQSSVAIWSNESHALVFVTAAPPTDATRSAVGVLFLLTRAKDSGGSLIATGSLQPARRPKCRQSLPQAPAAVTISAATT
jgi:hypothetical protein